MINLTKYSKEEWKRLEEDLHQYLIDSPNAGIEDIKEEGHDRALYKFYGNNLTKAKKAVGVSEKYIRQKKYSKEEWKEKKKNLHQYFIETPNATGEDVKEAGHGGTLYKFYDGRINEAKRDAGVSKEHIRHREYLKEEEWKILEKDLHQYFIDNPRATKEDIKEAGHDRTLDKFYNYNITKAKKDAGVPDEYIRRAKYSKKELKRMQKGLYQYLIDNPEATINDIEKAGHYPALDKFYGTKINEAKKDAGLPEKYIRFRKYSKEEEKRRKEDLHQYLIDSPNVGAEDIRKTDYGSDFDKLYKGNLTKAKKDAGVPDEYIRRAKYSKEEFKEIDEKFKKWLKEHPNAGEKEACKAGFRTIIRKFYHDSFNEAKEKCGIPKENIHYCREAGFWTKERFDKCYDELKREIKKKEKKDRAPSGAEFYNRYKGGLGFINEGKYPGIKNWTKYVKSRGDKPRHIFRDNKAKSEIIFSYFSSDAFYSEIQKKFDVSESTFYQAKNNTEVLELICKKIGINQSKIFNIDDLLDSGIHESKINIFLNKLTESEIAYQIGEDYTTDKRFLDDFNSIFEGFKVIKKRGRKLGVIINGKSHEYSRDMAVDINETKEREVTPVKRNNDVKRIGVVEDKGDYFQLLGMLNRLKSGNNSFEYQRLMQELEVSFVESYRNSPEWISQYKLADFLIGGVIK
ncbi:MAG: hypothetical protein KAT37_00215 [Candidatus Aenigmarchaeota archaeon]|nr:hypothetical protein [Candidatus Aenigmarchaeota archaeon]